MTELTLTLPDELANRAREAGLLTNEVIETLLREELRKQAGRELRAAMGKLTAGAAMSEEEIQAEIDAYRAEKRAARS